MFCVGETVVYQIQTFLSGDLHLETDEGRFNHCWESRTGTHTFLFPGEFPMVLISEIKGLEKTRDTIGFLTVLGARAEIGYEKSCDDIYKTEFSSRSQNAEAHRWFYNGSVISEEEEFSYTFAEKGVHEVILEVSAGDTSCPPHRDTSLVYVTEPFSDFTIEKRICAGDPYLLDASASTAFNESCSHVYNWEFHELRPISTSEPEWHQSFLPGRQEVKLTVMDVNGCTASSVQTIDVYGTYIDFELDTSICLPHQVLFNNRTTSDTLIAGWEWDFGSQEKHPEHIFTEPNLPSQGLGHPDSLSVSLRTCLLYTSPSPRDQRGSRMPSSA